MRALAIYSENLRRFVAATGLKGRFLSGFAVLLSLVAGAPRAAAAGWPVTRASHIAHMACGVGQIMHMADFLGAYPGCSTAILSYMKIDGDDAVSIAHTIDLNAAVQQHMGRDFWPQIAIETRRLTLPQLCKQLRDPDSDASVNARIVAAEIARYAPEGKWFFIRPFSEMNDASPDAPWEMGRKNRGNTPQAYASAWILLRRIFDRAGATNAIFVFSVLAGYQVHRENLALKALNLIPRGDIDAFGVNLYSRPLSVHGGGRARPIPFGNLARPWIHVLKKSRQHGIPLAVCEMGVSSQASDSQRAAWLRNAFTFTRKFGFVMVTYFNFPARLWQVHYSTRAGSVLWNEMNSAAGRTARS